MKRRSRGFTLVELLIYAILLVIAAGTLTSIIITLVKTQTQITAQPAAQAQAQDAIGAVAAFVRRAPLCSASSNCSGYIDSAFASATSTSLSVYTGAAGSTATFTNSNGVLYRTRGSTQVAIVPDSVTVRYKYLLTPTLTYTMASGSTPFVWVDTVTGNDLKSILAVQITASVTREGITIVQSSLVRTRNSPKKNYTTS